MNLLDALSQFYLHNNNLINNIGINMLLGLSLYVTLACGQLALANAGFMGIGAYTSAIFTLRLHTPFGISALAGVLAAMLAGFLIGLPVLRLRGIFLAIATIGFGEVAHVLIRDFDNIANGIIGFLGIKLSEPVVITGGALGINGIPAVATWWMLLLALVGLVIFFWRLRTSKVGYAFAAIREDEDAAQAMGIRVFTYRMLSFLISAGIAGLAGALNAHLKVNFISADEYNYSFANALQILMFAIIGGTTLYFGTMLGAALLTLTPQILDALNRAFGGNSPALLWLKRYPDAFNGLLLLLVIILLPEGIGSLLMALGRWIRRIRPPDHTTAKTSPLDAPAASPTVSREAVSTAPLLRVNDVSRNFGGVQALKNISFDVHQREIHGLIGPNGAGKTTLFNIVSGIIPPTAGIITFDNQTIAGLPSHQIAKIGITRTFQNIRLFRNLTVLENILVGQHRTYQQNLLAHAVFWPSARRKAKARIASAYRLLELVNLLDVKDRPALSLAYGDQRRLEIARALAAQPKLLLLDEPAAGMNETETLGLQALLRQILDRGVTILLVEHHMSLVMQISHRLTVLNFGQKIAEGTPGEIAENPAVIEAYLGKEEDDQAVKGGADEKQ